MSIPQFSKYVIIGAGIHGLSTAFGYESDFIEGNADCAAYMKDIYRATLIAITLSSVLVHGSEISGAC